MGLKKRGKFIKSNKDNFIYKNFKESLRDLKLIKNYIMFSTVLFLVIALIGAIFPVFFQEEILKLLKEIVEQTEGLGLLELTRYIMFNNITISFIALFCGIFLGIIPIGITVVNAYVLGFVINKSVILGGPLIILRLLPHGIFELPAIWVSIGLGLRLGLFLFVYQGKNRGREFWKWIVQSIRIFLLVIVPLLVVAGIIEGLLIWVLGG